MLGRIKTLGSALPYPHKSTGYREAQQQLKAWAFRTYTIDSSESQRTNLVVGGGRGLGLEYVKQLLEKPQNRLNPLWPSVFGASRSTESPYREGQSLIVYWEI